MAYRHPHARAIPLAVPVEAWLLFLSFLLAIYLIKSDVIVTLIKYAGDSYALSSFIAGVFFTSILTTAPAVVALGEISVHASTWQVALYGGLGALVGDILIFRFLRSRFVDYIMRFALSGRVQRLAIALRRGPLRWVAPLLGALIIASPLPDEIGLLLLGLSHIRTWQFVPIAFGANAFGIYLIAVAAQTLAR